MDGGCSRDGVAGLPIVTGGSGVELVVGAAVAVALPSAELLLAAWASKYGFSSEAIAEVDDERATGHGNPPW